MGWGEGDIQACDVVVVLDGPPQMGDGQDSAQSIHSQTGYVPGAPKAAPEVPKITETLRISSKFAFFNQNWMPVSSEIDELIPLSCEIYFPTGHIPEAQKQPRRVQSKKNVLYVIGFCICLPKMDAGLKRNWFSHGPFSGV